MEHASRWFFAGGGECITVLEKNNGTAMMTNMSSLPNIVGVSLPRSHKCYVVVSRKKQRQFDETQAQVIKETADNKSSVQRVVCQDSEEIELN